MPTAVGPVRGVVVASGDRRGPDGPDGIDVRVLGLVLPVVLLLASCAAFKTNQPMHAQIVGERGYGFVADSVGLSVESAILAGNGKAIQKRVLTEAFKGFRPGMVLRIGGNTSDQMFWTSKGESTPSSYRFSATPKAMENLAEVTKQLGWRVVMGVNLRSRDARRAADMAKHAHSIFGASLTAVAIGNEPNVYYPSNPPFGTFARDVRDYSNAIREEAPGVRIQAPDSSGHRYDFIWSSASQFASNQETTPDIYAAHFYGAQGCSTPTVRPSDLFTEFADDRRDTSLRDISRAASLANSPKVVLSEVNSVNCGGIVGTSNRLAGALWMLDFAFDAATRGFDGVYFHGSLTACIAYSPICVSDDRKVKKADPFKALTVLNGMANGMAMLSVVPEDSMDNIRLYALRGKRSLAFVVINTGESDTDGVDVDAVLPEGQFAELSELEMVTEDETDTDGSRLARKTSLRGSVPDLDSECSDGLAGRDAATSARVTSGPASAKIVFLCELPN